MDDELLDKRLLRTEKWNKEQIATLYEVTFRNGKTKFNLQVRDAGRIKPFIDKIFGKIEHAEDFLDNKLRKEVPS